MLGAIAGSFIATLTLRWGQGGSVGGRSHCDNCKRTLGVSELIPLLSHLLLGGRCRTCKAAIGYRQPLVEFAAALIAAAALFVSPNWTGVAGAIFGWQLLTLGLFDWEHYWLPDRLTVLLAISGLALGLGAFSDRFIGMIAAFATLEAVRRLYRFVRNRDGMGGGDPKLFGALGAWLGWQILPIILVVSCLIGIGFALLQSKRAQVSSSDLRVPMGALMALAAYPAWHLLLQRGVVTALS